MTATQERVPPALLARVLGVGRALALTAVPIGMIGTGYLVERGGVGPTIAVSAILYGLLTIILWGSRAMRQLDQLRKRGDMRG